MLRCAQKLNMNNEYNKKPTTSICGVSMNETTVLDDGRLLVFSYRWMLLSVASKMNGQITIVSTTTQLQEQRCSHSLRRALFNIYKYIAWLVSTISQNYNIANRSCSYNNSEDDVSVQVEHTFI